MKKLKAQTIYCGGNKTLHVYMKDEADAVIVHHKYKRCLDKVKWCDERISRYTLQQDIQGISWQKEIKFYRRLKDKFIEISKQFKEPK